jgi:hypothetical protein
MCLLAFRRLRFCASSGYYQSAGRRLIISLKVSSASAACMGQLAQDAELLLDEHCFRSRWPCETDSRITRISKTKRRPSIRRLPSPVGGVLFSSAMRRAFESAGIEFIEDHGVSIRKPVS